MAKASIKEFLEFATPHALRMANVLPYEKQISADEQWGYILGTNGQWRTWKGKKRWVTDCNGLAEWFLRLKLGGNHDTKSRYNYSQWCAGHNGTDMRRLPQIPGTAVFVYGPYGSLEIVHHVGFLWKKFGPGKFDWLVVEAAGFTKGVIISKFHSGWNRWGLMTTKFVYDTTTEELPESLPVLRRGSTDRPAVRKMQKALNRWYNLEVDGDFGPLTEAVLKRFQLVNKLKVTGVCEDLTWYALLN